MIEGTKPNCRVDVELIAAALDAPIRPLLRLMRLAIRPEEKQTHQGWKILLGIMQKLWKGKPVITKCVSSLKKNA